MYFHPSQDVTSIFRFKHHAQVCSSVVSNQQHPPQITTPLFFHLATKEKFVIPTCGKKYLFVLFLRTNTFSLGTICPVNSLVQEKMLSITKSYCFVLSCRFTVLPAALQRTVAEYGNQPEDRRSPFWAWLLL